MLLTIKMFVIVWKIIDNIIDYIVNAPLYGPYVLCNMYLKCCNNVRSHCLYIRVFRISICCYLLISCFFQSLNVYLDKDNMNPEVSDVYRGRRSRNYLVLLDEQINYTPKYFVIL